MKALQAKQQQLKAKPPTKSESPEIIKKKTTKVKDDSDIPKSKSDKK